MYKTFSRNEGKPGDKRKSAGLTYEKSINGKWLIVRDAAFQKLLKRLHITEGKTLREIGECTGIPHSTLQKALNDFGLMRSKKAKTQARDEFVQKNTAILKRMYLEDDMSVMQIVEIVNEKASVAFDESSMTRCLKKIGVDMRDEAERTKKAYAGARRVSPSVRGAGVFNKASETAWNYNLDINLSGLTIAQYRRIVSRFTYMVIARFPQLFPANASMIDRDCGMELDHQFSRFSGYYEFDGHEYVPRKNPVSLEIMCHPENLKLMTARANSQKSNRDHHSLPELQQKIKQYTRKHGDIFADYYERYCKDDLIKMHTENQRGKS